MGDETNEKAWATFKKERRNLILKGSRGQTFKINIHEARGCVFRS
jgi:hypothetical protein